MAQHSKIRNGDYSIYLITFNRSGNDGSAFVTDRGSVLVFLPGRQRSLAKS